MTELKPCPFCGKDAELFQRQSFGCDTDSSKDKDNWDTRCVDANCYLASGADWWLEKDIAVAIWNRRGD